ncbi:MAG: gamma-glutamyl-gamma-aminobutyrate hydrolase family protein [Candidatus Micrarchaeia archaeon]|jgi:GMP synthase (glutamine-hydrolysing)
MICIIDCGTSYMPVFQQRLRELGCQFKTIPLADVGKSDFSPFSGIIISGGPAMLSQVDRREFLAPFQFVKESGVPILGVCLGHQIIGLLHGSKISHGAQVKKMEAVEVSKDDALFAGVGTGSLFQESHFEHITLPDGFTLLAKSQSCANEAMKHRQKKIYGVQFHPEASGGIGTAVLRNFLGMCAKP